MIINIIVEKNNARVRFDKPAINFPFVFSFSDRTSGTILEVNLDLDAFEHFYTQLSERINLSRLREKLNLNEEK